MVNTGQTAQHPGFINGYANIISAKYFKTPKLAYRVHFGINTNMVNTKLFFNNPLDVLNNKPEPEEISDVSTTKTNSYFLSAGMEWRKGKTRVQGYYGGEVLLVFSNTTTINKYGVEMDTTAINNGFTNGDGSSLNGRILKMKSGLSTGIALRGFIGVEYFFAPKMSIGAEFGWGLGFMRTPRGIIITENWNTTELKPEEKEYPGSTRTYNFFTSTDDGMGANLMPSAALMLHFHF